MQNLFIQRSFKERESPEVVGRNLISHNFGLGTLYQLCYSIRVLEAPKNINSTDVFSNGRHQSGKYTFRITLCLTPELFEDIKKDVHLESMKESSSNSQWGHHDYIDKIPLTEIESNRNYVGLSFSKGREDLHNLLLPNIILFGGNVWDENDEEYPEGTVLEHELWFGDKSREILRELENDEHIREVLRYGKEG